MPIIPQAQQSQSPPIPVLPARPGAATGTQQAPATGVTVPGAVVVGGEASEARQAVIDARDLIREAVQTSIRTTAEQGQTSILVPPPGRDSDIPPEAIPLVGMTLSLIVAMIFAYPIARAIGRVIERRGEAGLVKATDVAPQLQQLQASVDTMAIELERISEAQRFTAKLMAERAALPGGRPAGE